MHNVRSFTEVIVIFSIITAKSQGKNKQIDLLQALEMSRLQLLQDMDSLNTTGSSSDLR